ncbi:MAG: SDR family oxidoreductase [Gammaproteobacteria bacterium]|nr:SDR family oxidoreductase [Gammaproteobacteria bacterium]
METQGLRALVLGGTSGIGAAIVQRLLNLDGHVVAASRRPRELEPKVFGQARYRYIAADVSRRDEMAQLVSQTVEELGGLDLVVHSVGGGCSGLAEELDPAAWLAAFDVHVHSGLYMAQQVVPVMRKGGGGSIIFISSAAAYRAPPDAIGYSTVKAAQIQMARCLANDVAKDGIRVNCISPGFVLTPYHDKTSPAFLKNLVENRIPLRRIGTSEEVADLTLAVAANPYVTGQSIIMDGGLNMSYR